MIVERFVFRKKQIAENQDSSAVVCELRSDLKSGPGDAVIPAQKTQAEGAVFRIVERMRPCSDLLRIRAAELLRVEFDGLILQVVFVVFRLYIFFCFSGIILHIIMVPPESL